MKNAQLVIAAICVVLFGAGGLVIQSMVNDDPGNDQLIAGGLWALFGISLYFLTRSQLKARRLRKEVKNVTDVVANTDMIARDVFDMESTLIQLFCMVYTRDEQSIPDARYYLAWKTKLFEDNRGSHSVLQRLKRGECPLLPQLGTQNPPPLTPRQERTIASFLHEQAVAFVVR